MASMKLSRLVRPAHSRDYVPLFISHLIAAANVAAWWPVSPYCAVAAGLFVLLINVPSDLCLLQIAPKKGDQ